MSLILKSAMPDIATKPHPQLGRQDLLFEGLVCDLQWATLHSGILAAVLAAKCQAQSTWSLRSWRHLLMNDANVALLVLRYSNEMRLTPSTSERAKRFYSELNDAIASSAPVFSKDYPSNALRRQVSSMLKLWQDMGRTGGQTLKDLSGEIANRLSSCYVANNATILTFLDSALSGTSGLVSAHGEIAFPRLAQRRHTVRVALKHDCVIRFATEKILAQVIDVSSQGVGLSCARHLPEDQSITIELDNGRQLMANVVWQNSGRAGLKLLEPLGNNDPLLIAAFVT
ncbi:MAG: PilZ domain-containing protein [Hyphomicrobium sp.]